MCHAANLTMTLQADLVTDWPLGVFLEKTEPSTQPLQSGTTQLWQQTGKLTIKIASAEMQWHRVWTARPEIMSRLVQDQQSTQEWKAPQERQMHKHTLATVKMANSETATLSSVICAYLGIRGMIDKKRSDLPLAKLLMATMYCKWPAY